MTLSIVHTLYARLALTLALALSLVALIYGIFMFSTVQKNTQYAEQVLNHNLAKTLVNKRNLVQENTLNKQALKDMFMAYMSVNPSIEIYLLDLDGKVVSYSADPGQVKRTHVALKPIQTFLAEQSMSPILGDDPRSQTRQKIFSVTPIPMTEHPSGYLYVILRGEQYDNAEQFAHDKELLQLGAWVVGLALLMSLIVGLFVFYPITNRLKNLSNQVTKFRQDDFKVLPNFNPKDGSDELSQLEQNVALMAKQTVQQFQQISKQDNQRRELFASLSHDLRTPLAALHGYLETLKIKAQTLDESQREVFTERAIQFTNRLTHLVDELFEMAKLDTLETAPHLEAFSLPELAQDIFQQFEGIAQQRGITLNLEGHINIPFVRADIALIQRVFENLIGNALRHVQQGDSITLSFQVRGTNIEISVDDTGCGIEAHALKHIFDPLFQVDNAHRGGQHSGLGLSIVQRIITLHASYIKVESIVNQGTTFIFTLPIDT